MCVDLLIKKMKKTYGNNKKVMRYINPFKIEVSFFLYCIYLEIVCVLS